MTSIVSEHHHLLELESLARERGKQSNMYVKEY